MIGKTAALAAAFLDPASLFKTQCAARYAAGMSTLAAQVNDAITPAPGEILLPALYRSDESSSAAEDATDANSCPSTSQ